MSNDSSVDLIGAKHANWRAVAGIAITLFLLLFISVLAFDIAVPQRGIGAFTALSAHAGLALAIAGSVTQLGDPWFLLLVATTVYL